MNRFLEVLIFLIALSLLSGCGTLINRLEDKYRSPQGFGPPAKLKSDLKFPTSRIYGGVAFDVLVIRQEHQLKSSSNFPFPLDIPLSLVADTLLLPLTIYEEFAGSLQTAAEEGKADEVTDLLRHGADINGTDSWGHTPLMAAAWAGHANIVTSLMYQGAKPDALSPHGFTALTYAAMNGHREVVAILLSGGADPNGGSDSELWSPLQYAANRGDADIAQLLIDKNAKVNARTDMGGWTPLMSSAIKGHFSVVDLLIKNKADINARNNSGETALLYAACHGHEAIVDVLIRHGADVNVGRELQPPEPQPYNRPVIPRRVDAMFFSPLSCAQHYGHNSIADTLKKAGGR